MNEYKYFAYYYDDLFNDINYKEWYDFIKPYLAPSSSILDLACGSGTLAILLKLNGYDIEGLDLSQTILELAKEKAKMNHLMIPFYFADMTSFQLNKTYDVITCFFDSVNFLKNEEEIKNLLNSVHRHLKPNGLFIFDMFSQKMLKDYKHNKVKLKTKMHSLLWKTRLKDKTTLMHTIRIKEGKEIQEEHYYEYYHDIQKFQQDGLKIEKICGDFKSTITDKDSRILIIMKKSHEEQN